MLCFAWAQGFTLPSTMPHHIIDTMQVARTSPLTMGLAMDMLKANQAVVATEQRHVSTEDARVSEHDEYYLVAVTAPGVAASDITIRASGGHLTILGRTMKGSKTYETSNKVALPIDGDAEAAFASNKDGVVTITVPKAISTDNSAIAVAAEDHVADDMFDGKYRLEIVAAGIAPEDLDLSVEEGVLTVRGETPATGATIDRSFRLPLYASAAGAVASHVDGILTVSVPVNKPAGVSRLIAVSDMRQALPPPPQEPALPREDFVRPQAVEEPAIESAVVVEEEPPVVSEPVVGNVSPRAVQHLSKKAKKGKRNKGSANSQEHAVAV